MQQRVASIHRDAEKAHSRKLGFRHTQFSKTRRYKKSRGLTGERAHLSLKLSSSPTKRRWGLRFIYFIYSWRSACRTLRACPNFREGISPLLSLWSTTTLSSPSSWQTSAGESSRRLWSFGGCDPSPLRASSNFCSASLYASSASLYASSALCSRGWLCSFTFSLSLLS